MHITNVHGQVFKKRKGLDGPYEFTSGHVLYFDLVENLYYDPLTDYYLSEEESSALKSVLHSLLEKEY